MKGRCSATNGNAIGCESACPYMFIICPVSMIRAGHVIPIIRETADYLEPELPIAMGRIARCSAGHRCSRNRVYVHPGTVAPRFSYCCPAQAKNGRTTLLCRRQPFRSADTVVTLSSSRVKDCAQVRLSYCMPKGVHFEQAR